MTTAVSIAIATLKNCCERFKEYSDSHAAKGTEDGIAKSVRNFEMLQECREAVKVLEAPEPDSILKLDKVQDYRFGSLIKGSSYAFARGLTINPTHLPAALDAMQEDGWELMALFGQTDSENVGFVFKSVGPDKRVQGLLEANTELVLRNRELRAAMQEFVDRVDRGEVRSKRTYAKFKELLSGD